MSATPHRYVVTTIETMTAQYIVEADDEQQAEEIVRLGSIDPTGGYTHNETDVRDVTRIDP